MSFFVLNRKYELQLPSSYVEVDREEMEYIDGGFYVSNQGVKGVLLAIGLNPVGGALLAYGYYKLTALIAARGALLGARFGVYGGTVGAIAGAAVGALGAGAVAFKVAQAFIEGRGLDFYWRRTSWGMPYMPDIDVR